MDIVQVVVEDQGRGFDATVLEELSDPPGFGLLSIRERAEALGGTLVIESAPGAGARFRLILPALKESQAADFAAAAELSSETADAAVEPPSPKIRLLIVDDHKSVRQGLMAMLDMQPGLEVVGEAADGLAALEQVAALQPQIVVMDVNMPRMNGIDATREISARYPHVVVIGLSLHRDEEITRQMRAAGAAASLNKDGPSELLVATIHAVHSARGEPKPAVRG
jgi:CheY-like chemotaxis protein